MDETDIYEIFFKYHFYILHVMDLCPNENN